MMSGSLLLKALVTLNTLQEGAEVVGDGITRVPRYANNENFHDQVNPIIPEQPAPQVSLNQFFSFKNFNF